MRFLVLLSLALTGCSAFGDRQHVYSVEVDAGPQTAPSYGFQVRYSPDGREANLYVLTHNGTEPWSVRATQIDFLIFDGNVTAARLYRDGRLVDQAQLPEELHLVHPAPR